MRKQIDECRVIPSGPGEAAGSARHHRILPLLLSPHSAVMWQSSQTLWLGKMKKGKCCEKLMKCFRSAVFLADSQIKEKSFVLKVFTSSLKQNERNVFFSISLKTFWTSQDCDSASLLGWWPLTLLAGVCGTGLYWEALLEWVGRGLEDRADVVCEIPQGKCAVIEGRGQGERADLWHNNTTDHSGFHGSLLHH